MKIILEDKLQELLVTNWANFIDKTKFMAAVLQNTRDAQLALHKTNEMPPQRMSLTITKFAVVDKSTFEIWVEFSVPIDERVAVGSHIYHLGMDGELELKESYGCRFESEA